MNFLLQQDWFPRSSDTGEFVPSEVLLNSSMYKIIAGSFRDPLISDEDSEEDQQHDIDAMIRDMMAKKKNKKVQLTRDFIPGLRPLPRFPKESSLSRAQHACGVRVLAQSDPTMSTFDCGPVAPYHRKMFQEMQEAYRAEQKEYMEWARTEWVNRQCVRALRPPRLFESVYEGEWAARLAAVASLPQHYRYCLQVPMDCADDDCELVHVEDLKKVDLSKLPEARLPILNRCQAVDAMPDEHVPRPCRRHPCRIVLPDEEQTCVLPLKEIHKELAKLGSDRGAACVVSERALKCLVQADTHWNLPVTVETLFKGGRMQRVVVVGSDVTPSKEMSRSRIARALQLLLRHTLTKNSGTHKSSEETSPPAQLNDEVDKDEEMEEKTEHVSPEADCSSEDEDNLLIDFVEEKVQKDTNNELEAISAEQPPEKLKVTTPEAALSDQASTSTQSNLTKTPVAPGLQLSVDCSCRGTPFENPPHISYKKWELKKKSTGDCIPIIIHCSHKHVLEGAGDTEVVLDAIPELQVDLGAAAVSPGRRRSCALSLHLRKKAVLISTRIDAYNGQIVSYECTERERLEAEHGGRPAAEAVAAVYSVLSELSRLNQDRYLLHHEPQHGENALLFKVYRPGAADASGATAPQTISLAADNSYSQEKERKSLQMPPALCVALLPCHRARRILPLAFSPCAQHVQRARPDSREDRKMKAIQAAKKLKNARKRANRAKKRKSGVTHTAADSMDT